MERCETCRYFDHTDPETNLGWQGMCTADFEAACILIGCMKTFGCTMWQPQAGDTP